MHVHVYSYASVLNTCISMYFIIRVFMYMHIEDCMQMSRLVPGLSPRAIIRPLTH